MSKHSWVYFVEHGTLIKIGTSLDVAHRLKTVPGRLLAIEPGGYEREKELHTQFKGLREYREWFRADPPLMRYVAQLPPDPTGVVEASRTDRRVKQLKPGVDQALDEVIEAHEAMRTAEEDRREAARRRADAINRTIDLGMTLKEIGEHLDGISPQRVQQMRTAK